MSEIQMDGLPYWTFFGLVAFVVAFWIIGFFLFVFGIARHLLQERFPGLFRKSEHQEESERPDDPADLMQWLALEGKEHEKKYDTLFKGEINPDTHSFEWDVDNRKN